MSTLEIKGKDGKVVGKHELKDALASVKVTPALLHRAVVSEEANARQGTQAAKTRSEVRGGGRKPYKQKKTGNARQGTIRAPHYTHGGVVFAVKPRSYEKKLNRKERRAAIMGALASKIEAGAVIIADKIAFAEPKTKSATELLRKLDLTNVRRLLVVIPEYDDMTYRSFRNIPGVEIRTAPSSKDPEGKAAKTSSFSVRDVLVAHKILIAQDALKRVEEVWS